MRLLDYFKRLNADTINRSHTRRLADSAASFLSSGLTCPESISESNVISIMHFVSAIIGWNNWSFNNATLPYNTRPPFEFTSLKRQNIRAMCNIGNNTFKKPSRAQVRLSSLIHSASRPGTQLNLFCSAGDQRCPWLQDSYRLRTTHFLCFFLLLGERYSQGGDNFGRNEAEVK